MYWYVWFGEYYPQPGDGWKPVTRDVIVFGGVTEVALTPDLSRFEVRDEILPYLTYLPQRSYQHFTVASGVEAYLENGRWLAIATTDLRNEGAVRRFLGLA